MFFRTLTAAEEGRFRSWARLNYTAGSPVLGIWHPIAQAECVRINLERATFVTEPAEA